MTEQSTTEAKIKEFIIEKVGSHWDLNQGAYLLSRLGTLLKRTIPDSEALLVKGLKNYLRQWPIVQVIAYPDIDEKIGLVPLGVPLPEDVRTLFVDSFRDRREARPPSYNDQFWKAFTRPLTGPRFIVIDVNNNFSMGDHISTDPSTKSYPVEATDLVSDAGILPGVERVQLVHKNIEAWLARHALDRSIFLKDRPTTIPKSAEDRLAMLKKIFEDIPPTDLARISIPMDILIRMISRN